MRDVAHLKNMNRQEAIGLALDWGSPILAPAAYLVVGATLLTLVRACGLAVSSADFSLAWDVVLCAAGLWLMKRQERIAEKRKLSDAGQLACVAFCVAMFFVAQCAATIVYTLTQDAAFTAYKTATGTSDAARAAALVCVVAPVVEEVLFRGVVLYRLSRRCPLWVAALVSSVAFAATHGTTVHMLPATLMGLTCCAAYVLCGRIGLAMAIHVAYNLFSCVAPSLPVAQILFVPAFTIPLALAMCAGLCLVIRDQDKWRARLCKPIAKPTDEDIR